MSGRERVGSDEQAGLNGLAQTSVGAVALSRIGARLGNWNDRRAMWRGYDSFREAPRWMRAVEALTVFRWAGRGQVDASPLNQPAARFLHA